MADKEVNDRQKKYGLLIFLAIGVIILITGLVYLHTYNYWSFSNNMKVSGLKDNQIKSVDLEYSGVAHLFDSAGEIKFNMEAKRMSIFADYYQKDKLISSERIVDMILGEKGKGINGRIAYGLLKGEMYIDYIFGGVTSRFETVKFQDIVGESFSKEKWSSRQIGFDIKDVAQLNMKYTLYITHTGLSLANSVLASSLPEGLENTDHTISIYMVFE